jgi:hypothetical protein
MTADWQGKKGSTTGTRTLPAKNEHRKMPKSAESGRRPPASMNGLPEVEDRSEAEIIDLDLEPLEPLPASDPCVEAMIAHRRSRGEPASYLEDVSIQWQLDHLREALHIKPIRKAGRPKGSVKRDTVELLSLWTGGLSGQQICKQLSYPQQDWQETWKVLYARIRSVMRRQPKHERLAVSKARRDARAARKVNRVKTR